MVCGEGIQRKLLAEKELDAYRLAQSIETAERDSRHMKSNSASSGTAEPRDVHFHAKSAKGNRTTDSGTYSKGPVTCYRCGGPHLAPKCKMKDVECLYCKKKGHLARVCRSKAQQQKKKPAHYVEEDKDDDSYSLFTIREQDCDTIIVNVSLNSVPELDTGASISVLSSATYLDLQRQDRVGPLQPSSVKLKSYTGDAIPVLGSASLQARYCNGKQQVAVVAQVVEGDGPNLLGRDWLVQLEVDLGSIQVNVLKETTALDEILDKHSIVFSDELGCMQGPKVELFVDEKAKPKFHEARSVPFMLRAKVEAELQRLGLFPRSSSLNGQHLSYPYLRRMVLLGILRSRSIRPCSLSHTHFQGWTKYCRL